MSRVVPLLILLLMPVGHAMAEAMLLVQGYLGDGDPWRRSGVATALAANGWQDGGHLFNTPRGVTGQRRTASGGKIFYTVALPTDAPLWGQMRALVPVMHYLRQRHVGESLYLVGHSAGGVLARLYMVQYPEAAVQALITIASPHLGTATAEAGLMVGDSPLGWFAPFMEADELNRSRALYYDLAREQSGNLLFWLNRQPHPRAHYISVVHQDGGLFGLGDIVVPDWSQDMNNVVILRGRARTVYLRAGHNLTSVDGQLLLGILSRLQQS